MFELGFLVDGALWTARSEMVTSWFPMCTVPPQGASGVHVSGSTPSD